MSKKQMNNEAGFMGLEGMGALLFYLVMLAGAALLIVQLFSGGKLSETEKALSSLRMGIQQLYTAQGNYGTASEAEMTKTVANAGILPAGFVSADKTTITSPWNTAVTVAPADEGKQFTITVLDVPADDCVKLATYDLDAWLDVTIDGTTIKDPDSTNDMVTEASTACKGTPAKFVFTAK